MGSVATGPARIPQPCATALRPAGSVGSMSFVKGLFAKRLPFTPGVTLAVPAETTTKALVSEHMTPAAELVTLTAGMTLSDAACTLSGHGISGAPVVSDTGLLLGVLSQRDLLYRASGHHRVRFVTDGPRSERHIVNTQRMRHILEGDVASIMSVRPATVYPHTTMRDAAKMLIDRGISRVPVVDDAGALVGLLSTTDIMATITHGDDCSVGSVF